MIDVATLKEHLRIVGTSEDAYIAGLEAAAVAHVERVTERFWRDPESVTEYLTGGGERELWLTDAPNPTASIDTVDERLYPGDTATTITASASDGFIQRGAKLVRKAGLVWLPGYEYEVTYTRGYDPDDVPADVKHVVQLIVGHWYERRVPLPKVGETLTFPVPHHVDAIIKSWGRWKWA